MGFDLNSCKSNFLLKLVKKTIISNRMVFRGEKVLVAVSGGADSIALLHVLYLLAREHGINLGVAHLDHMLRGNTSKRDKLFVQSVAHKLSIPFYCVSANVMKVKRRLGLSIEESSRKIRYAFFRKLVFEYSFSKVALAHHMEDNAESILMFMLRGSGSAALSGILPVRDNLFIRPFIRLRKFQILNFLLDEGFRYSEDESNTDLKFTRNRIRHSLMPMLSESFNPKIVDSLNRIAVVMADENVFLDEVVKTESKEAIIDHSSTRISFSVPALNELHLAIRRRIIRRGLLLLLGSLRQITFTHIESIIGLIKDTSGTRHLCLPGSVQIRRVYKKLLIEVVPNKHFCVSCISKTTKPIFTVLSRDILPLTLQNDRCRFNFSVIEPSNLSPWSYADRKTAFFDLKFLKFPIFVRHPVTGDGFNPLGMQGSQKLKAYFVNKKIPLSERADTLVVDDNGSIIWLVERAICNYARVTKATKEVLMIEFCLLKVR